MRFHVRHVTRYAYGNPAAEAYGEARLTPPELAGQRIINHRLSIEPETRTSGYTDHYGNRVEFFSLPYRHRKLVVTSEFQVETSQPSRPEGLTVSADEARLIFGSALTDVFDYLQPTPTVVPGREAVKWARRFFRGDKALGDSLRELNEAIHDTFAYTKGFTDNSTPLSAVWKARKGVCQDFAHIGLSVLRTAGIPARYVCGYIEAAAPGATGLVGAMATHAWIEALVPGMAWVAFDPTNRQWINERYVTVSYGRDFRDATPLRGTFKGAATQKMEVRVSMRRLAPRKSTTD